MKLRTVAGPITMVILTALVAPVGLAAQDSQPAERGSEAPHRRYRLVDVGTFGGPDSYFIFGVGLNDRGQATGAASTPTPDSFNPNCIFPDCFVGHAFLWQDGVAIDLGALPGTNNSGVSGMNSRGTVVGVSENGLVDPVINFPDLEPVVWKDGRMIDLGTFGGNFGQANAINDRGQVVGFATNTISTPVSIAAFGCDVDLPVPTQSRAFIWEGGAIQDLGTLGGTDSCAVFINRRGQVAGYSFTDLTANPPVHPFLWHHGTMLDLGTLGGTQGFANALNNRGEVVGDSSLAQNPGACTNPPTPGCHPFLWDGGRLIDLGTLGGDNGNAESLNDAAEVVGEADLPGTSGSQLHHAFFWQHGVMTDLGTQDGDPCSLALSINSPGQVVGGSTDCGTLLNGHAFLWEQGGPMVDLNSFVPLGSNLTLTVATLINNRGEIAAQGVLSNGDTHAILLIPCDEEHGEREGCEDESAGAGVLRQARASRSVSGITPRLPAWQRMSRFRFSRTVGDPKN